MPSILFLCTGNYYRSRVAEIYFNHHAEQLRLSWKATSRGLARSFYEGNVGPISTYAVKALEMWGIPIPEDAMERYPLLMTAADFDGYEQIIAVSEAEHLPMIEEHFPSHKGQVTYFEIGDLHLEPSETAMPRLREELNVLLHELVRLRD